GHIGHERQRTAALTLDQRLRLRKLVGRSRHQGDVMLASQRLGEGASQPTTGAGDDRDGHGILPAGTLASVVAIQIPANTASRPTRRLSVTGSPTSCWASRAAAMGLTVMVLATRVGDARCRAITHRMKASAPPAMPR